MSLMSPALAGRLFTTSKNVHSGNRDRKITLQKKKNLTNTSSAKLTKTISSVINHIQVCYLNMMFWRELKKKKKLLELMSLARLWDIILIYETNLFVYTSNKQPDIEI